MDDWTGQCQLLLHATHGMDYHEFYTFLQTIAKRRIETLTGRLYEFVFSSLSSPFLSYPLFPSPFLSSLLVSSPHLSLSFPLSLLFSLNLSLSPSLLLTIYLFFQARKHISALGFGRLARITSCMTWRKSNGVWNSCWMTSGLTQSRDSPIQKITLHISLMKLWMCFHDFFFYILFLLFKVSFSKFIFKSSFHYQYIS